MAFLFPFCLLSSSLRQFLTNAAGFFFSKKKTLIKKNNGKLIDFVSYATIDKCSCQLTDKIRYMTEKRCIFYYELMELGFFFFGIQQPGPHPCFVSSRSFPKHLLTSISGTNILFLSWLIQYIVITFHIKYLFLSTGGPRCENPCIQRTKNISTNFFIAVVASWVYFLLIFLSSS